MHQHEQTACRLVETAPNLVVLTTRIAMTGVAHDRRKGIETLSLDINAVKFPWPLRVWPLRVGKVMRGRRSVLHRSAKP